MDIPFDFNDISNFKTTRKFQVHFSILDNDVIELGVSLKNVTIILSWNHDDDDDDSFMFIDCVYL